MSTAIVLNNSSLFDSSARIEPFRPYFIMCKSMKVVLTADRFEAVAPLANVTRGGEGNANSEVWSVDVNAHFLIQRLCLVKLF